MKWATPLIIVILLAPLIGWFPPAEPVHALNAFIDPNGDGSTGAWSSTAATFSTEIDEAIRQPNTPTTADNISNSANNGTNIFQRMSSITGATTTTSITVWVYHNDGSNGQIELQLVDDDETTTRSGTQSLTQSSTNAWHSVTFSGLSLTQAELDSLSVRMSLTKNGGGQPATVLVYAMYADVTYSSLTPAFEQSAFRLFNSINSTDVGTPLAAQDSTAVLNAGGDEFRLRLLLHVSDAALGTSAQSFKLQFVDRGSGSCSSPSGGTPATYTDVTTGTLIAYNNLTSGVSDGDALTANANDPQHGTDTTNIQTVEESNNFTNSQSSIAVGEDGMWDFALIDNNAPAATTYCFRVVQSDGTLLDTYTVYPAVTTGNGVLAVDIVDGTGTPVASPAFSMSNTGYLFTCDTTTTAIGDTSQRIEVSNFTATPSWTVTIAATGGPTASWSSGTANYDFNDGGGTPAGCADGADADSLAGQLTIDPTVATITPRTGCSNTGVNTGSSASFNQGSVDSITLLNASSSAQVSCSWELTGVDATQQIPADQASGSYSINLTLTATAV